jgi:large repetitive protein
MPYTSFTYGDPSVSPSVIATFDFYSGLFSTAGTVTLAPVWTNFTFAPAVVGVSYSENFDLAPATAPTTYTVTSGALPGGLSLSNVSADVGEISGTPTTAGTYTFTLTATNAYGSASKSFTITVVTAAGGGTAGGSWTWAA